jgi:hypothetical protein
MDELLDIGGTQFIIDFNALEALLNIDPELGAKEIEEKEVKEVWEKEEYIGKEIYTKTYQKGKEIDMTRYEMVRMLFEVVLTYDIEMDDTLGVEIGLGKASIPFKLSFNTLVNYGIIKEIE